MSFDADVAVKVLHAAEVAARRGAVLENVGGWTTTVIRRRAADIAKGAEFRNRAVMTSTSRDDSDDAGMDQYADDQDGGDVSCDALDPAVLDSLRHRLAATCGHRPRASSAALTMISVIAELAEPGGHCPRPMSGATSLDAAAWVGLWYAGQRDLFPLGGASDTPAVRKARSRAMSFARTELVDRIAETGADHAR